jgi:nucleotide-binding universal stress UspA family protein
MKIMVAYDGTLQAKDALVYGIDKAREKGGEVVAFHVFNSPLFIDYDATPNAEALARAESDRFVEEAKAIIREKGKGVKTSLYTGEGNPDDEVIAFAREEHADILLCPPRYSSIIRKYQRALGASDLVRGAEELDLAAVTVPEKRV